MYTLLMITSRDVRGGGGASYRITNLAKYISRKGLRVIIANGKRNSYIEVFGGQPIERKLPYSFLISLLSHTLGIIDRFLTFILRFSKEEVGRVSSTFDIPLFLDTLRIALHEKPHIIQVEEYFSLVPLASILKRVAGSKLLILDEHNVETNRLMGDPKCGHLFVRLIQILERLACGSSDCVFVVSKLDAHRLRVTVGYDGKIEVIPNFVCIEEIEEQIEESDSLLEESPRMYKPLLVFHGDFRYFPNREAVRTAITTILPTIRAVYPKAMLIVAGPGLPKMTRPNVIFLGYVRKLYKLVSVADVAVVPLLRGGGTRIKVLEYMACGVPIISTAVGVEGLGLENHKDVIVADIDSFADNIILLVEDPNLRNLLLTNAMKKVKENYSAEKVAEKVKSVYLRPSNFKAQI